MTRAQRRGKTSWIRQLKRHGYTYRRGRVWQKWRWHMSVGLTRGELPIYHADHEGDWDWKESDR